MRTSRTSRSVAAAALFLAVSRAAAIQDTYTGATGGNWTVAASWTTSTSTHVVPAAGDDAVVGSSQSTFPTSVNFNMAYASALNSLTINATPVLTFTLNQTTVGTVMLATTETLGTTSFGDFYNHSAGNNTMTTMNLGTNGQGSSQGCYSLSGTGNVSAVVENVGLSSSLSDGGNLFAQSGGNNTVTTMIVGGGTSGVGCYTISAGTLSAGQIQVGASSGAGNTFSQNGTGATSATNGIYVGVSSGQAGSFVLAGGTVQLSGVDINIGYSGVGTMTHSAGSLTFGSPGLAVVVGANAGSTGSVYTLSGTGQVLGAAKVEVGKSGNGSFVQTGGGIGGSPGETLYVGENSGAFGCYTLNNTTGIGNITMDTETIGKSGTGSFQQDGGNNSVTTTLTLGSAAGSVGNYTLNGGALTVPGPSMIVGHDGTGTFTQTGGTVNGGGSTNLYLGDSAGSGTYIMNGNTSTPILVMANEEVGTVGSGNFSQSAGNNSTSGNLYLGVSGGSNGFYTLSGGNLSVGSRAFIGNGGGGNGTFTQTGGTATVFDLWVGQSGSGFYSMSNAGSTLHVTDAEIVGNVGLGTFTQGGGNHTIATSLTVGNASTGMYNMNGGNLTVGSGITVGIAGGTGTIAQGGGNLTLNAGVLVLGNIGSPGTYQMSGGTASAPALYIGNGGAAQYAQTGGSATYGTLYVNQGGGYAGTDSASLGGAGSPTLTVTGSEFVGYAGNGNFTQTSGTHTINGGMVLAQGFNVVANYELDGGTFTDGVNLILGSNGCGTFTQFGGNASVGATMYLGSQAGTTGTYTQFGGNLTASLVDVGYNGVGTVNQSGGNFTVINTLSIGVFSSATAVYNLSSLGTLNLANNPSGFQYGFISSNGTFNQSGGTVNGYLLNSGQYNFSGGTFNGTFENGVLGTATFTGFVYVGAGIKNHGTMNINGGQVGTAAGQTFTNDGMVVLSNLGQIYSLGNIINNGTLTGVGSIGGTSGFTNNLLVTQGNGTLVFQVSGGTGSFNLGTFNLANGHLFSLFTTLTNGGTFAVNGGLVSSGGFLVNVAGGVVTGPGTIATPFSNGGTVAPGSGTLNIQFGWNNTGAVELTGVTSALTGAAIANTGTIQGFGTVGSNVNNTSGTIESMGGTLVLGGVVTNTTAASTITTSTGSKVLITSGLATNAGLIDLEGGIFDNGGAVMSNTGQITGFGTLRTGGLTNTGNFTLSGTNGSTTTVTGAVTNSAVGLQHFSIMFNPAIFTGNFTNSVGSTVKTTSTTVTFGAAFTNNGTYTSDPSTNIFQSDVTSSGTMTGGAGDAFYFSGGNLTNSGTFTNGGTLNSSDPTVNTGTFTQSGAQTWANNSTFVNNGGTASFNSDTGSVSTTPLSVTVNAGNVNFGSTQHLASLSVQNGLVSILAGATKTNALTFGGTTNAWVGQVDLTTAKLIVEATSNHAAALVLAKNEAGYGHTHSAGITSSVLPANKVLVISDNAIAGLTSFGGVNVDAGSILETVTWKGDFNLDGVVDLKDLQILATHWQQPVTDWSQADFDGNGIVALPDLQALATTWQDGVGGGGGGGEVSFGEALAGMPAFGGTESVPEPTTLGLMGVGMGMLVRRRRNEK